MFCFIGINWFKCAWSFCFFAFLINDKLPNFMNFGYRKQFRFWIWFLVIKNVNLKSVTSQTERIKLPFCGFTPVTPESSQKQVVNSHIKHKMLYRNSSNWGYIGIQQQINFHQCQFLRGLLNNYHIFFVFKFAKFQTNIYSWILRIFRIFTITPKTYLHMHKIKYTWWKENIFPHNW